MSVIANTTVISNFAAVEQLELLHTRFGKLYISDHVFEEIQDGLTQGYTFYTDLDKSIFPFSERGWLHLATLSTADELHMYGNLLALCIVERLHVFQLHFIGNGLSCQMTKQPVK
jgi:hypothetical protein